jgi:hypothetical protein
MFHKQRGLLGRFYLYLKGQARLLKVRMAKEVTLISANSIPKEILGT